MPILLPAPLPPEQIELPAVRQQEETQAARYGEYRIHWMGPRLLEDQQLQRAMAQQKTLSDAVRAIAAAVQGAGHPAARLRYALDGQDLYLMVEQGSITEIRAPEPLQDYFTPVLDVAPLTDDVLEPPRLLASVRADRAGLSAEPKLIPLGENRYALELVPDPEGPEQREFGLAASNPGNRYVGRYFLDADWRLARDSGSEYTLNWRTGLTGIDDSPAEDFDEVMGSWSRVFDRGVLGIEAHYMDYAYRLNGFPIDGELREYRVVWLHPLAANFERRWSLRLQADHVDKTQTPNAPGQPEQSESYPSLEAAAMYARRLDWWAREVEAKGQFGVRKGLRDRGTFDKAELDYLLLRPSGSLSMTYNTQWTFSADAAGQYSRDGVPEQSQWVLGGLDALSAWLPGVVVGDTGLLLRASAAWKEHAEGTFLPKLFVEYGYSENNRGLPGTPDHSSAADIGAAVQFPVLGFMNLDLIYAHPLMSDLPPGVDREMRAHLLFKLTANL